MTSSNDQSYLDFLATSVFKNPFERTWRAPLSEEQWEALQNIQLPFSFPNEERSAAERMDAENALRSSSTPNRNSCTGEVSVRKKELASIRNSITKLLGDLNGVKSMLNGLLTTA